MKELVLVITLITLGITVALTIGNAENSEKLRISNEMKKSKASLLRQLELYPNPSLEN